METQIESNIVPVKIVKLGFPFTILRAVKLSFIVLTYIIIIKYNWKMHVTDYYLEYLNHNDNNHPHCW